jgi:hypothetical protein
MISRGPSIESFLLSPGHLAVVGCYSNLAGFLAWWSGKEEREEEGGSHSHGAQILEIKGHDRHGETTPPRQSHPASEAARSITVRTPRLLPQPIGGYYHLDGQLHWTGPLMRAWINTFKPIIRRGYPTSSVTEPAGGPSTHSKVPAIYPQEPTQ